MKYLLTFLLLLCTVQGQAPLDGLRAVIVEPGDSVLVQGLPGEGMRLRTAWSLNRSGNPIRGGWTAMDQYITLKEQDQLDVGNYYLRSWSDTTAFVPSFIPFRPDTGRIPYRLPDSDWTVYIARVGPAPADTSPPAPQAPPDTANLLEGLSWRHILYGAEATYENLGDTLLRAYTWSVPGIYAHTPQIVASGWPATEGDSMYAQFQVRGDKVEKFRLDINTGPVGPVAWGMHYTDTIPVTTAWTWHTAAFEAQYSDPDNRFDLNLGLDTGWVQFRHLSLRGAYVPPATEVEQDSTPPVPPNPCPPADTVVLRDTVRLPAPPPDTVILRDTLRLPPPPPDTVRITLRDTIRANLFLIEEVNGQEISRKKISN